LLSDSATYGASSILGRLINFFLLPLYTRYLDPSDYGVLAMLAILTWVFPPLAHMGMTNATFRHFNLSQDPGQRIDVLSTGLFSVLGSAGILFAASQAFAPSLTSVLIGPTASPLLVRLTLLSALLVTVGEMPSVVLRAERRVKTTALVNLAKLLISICLTLWLVVSVDLGVLGVVMGTLGAEIAVLPLSFLLTKSSLRLAFSGRTWGKMVRYGIPFVPHRLQALGIAAFGLYMVRYLLSLEEAGLYNIAFRFATPVAFAISAVQRAWVPYKFQVFAEAEDPAGFFRTTFTFYFATVTGLWVVISLWGPVLVVVMTPPEFHQAAMLVPYVALVPVTTGLYFMLGSGFELGENTRPLPIVSFAGLITVVAATLLFVPHMGPRGAALGGALGWCVMAGIILSLSRSRFLIRYDWPLVTSIGVLGAVLIGAGSLARDLPAALKFPVLATAPAIYLTVTVLLLLRSRTERQSLMDFWSWLRRKRSATTRRKGQEEVVRTTRSKSQ